ncbi:MAG: YggS family pyridoxal phosphate-dependent enzyme [Phycisphaerae bacterium]|nr:YggS family pyridoxal phosphate-dependent enzyme [Phycisphaerae bacterium]
MFDIADKIQHITNDINETCAKVGRNSSQVKLVIVTKSAEFEQIKEVITLGCTDFGESRVQQLKKVAAQVDDFLDRAESITPLPSKIDWHMIGHLQRNKIQQILPIVSLIHSVDSLRLAEEINSSAAKLDICPRILLQVNTSEEPQKYGVPVGAAIHLAEQFQTMPNIQLAGLMTMASLTLNEDIIRRSFSRARDLFFEIKGEKVVGPQFTELSMGMSNDYRIAIEEGATILRIGSAIFAG